MTRYTLGAVIALGLASGTTPAGAQQGGRHSLDASFAQADRNKDGFLDADELAKAFRGPNATATSDKVGARESHRDHQFLYAWDANKDGKISKAEFEKYEAKLAAEAKVAANRYRAYQHRVYQQQRAYANLLRRGAYSPSVRGGYRGAMTHHRGRRR